MALAVGTEELDVAGLDRRQSPLSFLAGRASAVQLVGHLTLVHLDVVDDQLGAVLHSSHAAFHKFYRFCLRHDLSTKHANDYNCHGGVFV